MEEKKIDLSIVILSHNSKTDLERLLPSVFSSADVSFDADKSARYIAEVILVDNGSNDETLDWLRVASYELRVIENQNNGFAHGNNLGIKKAFGKYVLLLNPDTKLEPNTLQTMLDFMEQHSDVGISGPKIVKADGTLDLAARRRFPNPWNSFQTLLLKDRRDYNYIGIDENQSMEVDSVVGAFLLIRKSVIDKIGLLDESFFMYGEDLDWCWRCKEAGLKVWYYPPVSIIHYKGSSSKKTPFKALKWFHNAMWIFYRKHYSQKYFFLINWLVFLGIYLRLGLLIIINSFKKEPRVSK